MFSFDYKFLLNVFAALNTYFELVRQRNKGCTTKLVYKMFNLQISTFYDLF